VAGVQVGGPAPGISTAIPGIVTISDSDTGAVTTSAADNDGHFAGDVPAGTYTLSATSPHYNDSESDCHAIEPVSVNQGGTSTVDIVCAMK
jgi:hypothetical protein